MFVAEGVSFLYSKIIQIAQLCLKNNKRMNEPGLIRTTTNIVKLSVCCLRCIHTERLQTRTVTECE